MIPKTIHYCWFGNNPKTELAEKCIASWKKHLPDYELIEWNETNFDVNQHPFTREAYQAKKIRKINNLLVMEAFSSRRCHFPF